jgi:hypothetical protein
MRSGIQIMTKYVEKDVVGERLNRGLAEKKVLLQNELANWWWRHWACIVPVPRSSPIGLVVHIPPL